MSFWGYGLLNGLRISMRNFRRGPITVQYPEQKLTLPERARWAVAPTYNDDGTPKCTACMTCVKTCPDFVLDLQVTTDPETKDKHIDHFSYQVGACMMCGLCVEACPFDAIEMSRDYELATTDPAELEYDLLTDVDAYKRKPAPKPAAPAAPAAGAPATEAPAAREEAPAAEKPADDTAQEATDA